VTILGIAGEAHRLTDEERRQVVAGLDPATLEELTEVLRACAGPA
jgi:hypothetical protein